MSLSRKFFVRTSKDPSTSPFVDVQDPTSYCYDAVLWAVENGVTNGYDDTHFLPSKSCNRAQIVTFLKGITTTTFAPSATCTRGQGVTFLYRARQLLFQ